MPDFYYHDTVLSGHRFLDSPTVTATMSSASDGATPVESVTLDEFGDLRLVIGSSAYSEFIASATVCSRTVARTSSVFKLMLYGGFSESKPTTGEWVVTLPEDSPAPFIFILKIMHGRDCDVPKDLRHVDEFKENPGAAVYRLAVLADKYDLLNLLCPWAKLWFKPWSKEGDICKNSWSGEVLSAEWLFGIKRLFQNQLDRAFWHAHLASRLVAPRKSTLPPSVHKRARCPSSTCQRGQARCLELEGFSGTSRRNLSRIAWILLIKLGNRAHCRNSTTMDKRPGSTLAVFPHQLDRARRHTAP